MSEPTAAGGRDLSNTVGDFAELVAAGTPAPGGGSVAAYSGMLAASLGLMMCNVTIGKPKYAGAESRLKEIRADLEQLSARLRELIADDAESFEAVLRAYRLPKETDAQKSARAEEIEIALRGAIEVPFETAERSFAVLTLLGELAELGSSNALSDVAVGGRLAEAAIRGASYNVGVNLSSLSDPDSADELRKQVNDLIERAREIAEAVEARLKV